MNFLTNIKFANPEYFWLLLLVPLLILWYVYSYNKKNNPSIKLPTLLAFTNKKSFRQKIRHLPFILRMLTVILLIIVLARPQTHISRTDTFVEGIDIVITLDISGSMLAEDFKPNRLEAAKDVAIEFINNRPNDRIGLVVFSGESFTQCPLTTDHRILKELFLKVKSGMIDDGTAIGLGLATAVNRLKGSEAISKVIILLTDGVNNMGAIAPLMAAEICKIYGIRVYTIGVGAIGTAPYPFKTPFGIQYQNVKVEIDEPLLQKIAEMTGGIYFRATSKDKLKEIYKEIDQLEKTKIEMTYFSKKKELFFIPLFLAVMFFMFELFLKYTYLKALP